MRIILDHFGNPAKDRQDGHVEAIVTAGELQAGDVVRFFSYSMGDYTMTIKTVRRYKHTVRVTWEELGSRSFKINDEYRITARDSEPWHGPLQDKRIGES